MLRITCPFCGPRDHNEFTYGGDASVVRPSLDESSLEAWYRYVFVRANPKGPHCEYWQHTGGCRAWLIVERDTATHEIASTRLAAASRQAAESDHG